jgi:hypothetical protein
LIWPASAALSSRLARLTVLRARVLESEMLNVNYFGFGLGVGLAGHGGHFGLGANAIQPHGADPIAFDGTTWHDFRLVGNMNDLTFAIYVDDQLLYDGPMLSYPADHVWCGDGTSGSNARAEVQRLEFVLGTNDPVAVEDGSWGEIKALFR